MLSPKFGTNFKVQPETKRGQVYARHGVEGVNLLTEDRQVDKFATMYER